ncbi:endonuclease domain-containing 1 protein-like [Acipenser oxyrinchus oxyrinchus]|uniref:Endonuclease domain-containing 1 protein-like n=1 Tax=Acipenser oxyrinchus oxyrinchus TaxID=40147 RepID=A0AAD8CMY8_ACIOX|nr:endonuclease domain-containing 1 protein-like [Acipenser oxyrinchus oxyrinchus]
MLSSLICVLFALITLWSVNATVLMSDTFQNSPCMKFFYKNQELTGFEDSNYARICQSFRDRYYFASLYDKERRIPLYSASLFNYKDPLDKETDMSNEHWKYEAQLAYPSQNGNMQQIDSKVKDDPIIKQSQPVEIDYNKLYQKVKYTRGHLNPNSYMGSKSSKASTFTVTNAPPQPRGFNQEQWRNTENRMLGLLNDKCHVVSGVIPYQAEKWIPDNTERRVAVPEFVWMAYCCPDHQPPTGAVLGHSDGSGTVTIGEGADKLQFKPAEIKDIEVCQLEAILSSRLQPKNPISIFKDGCNQGFIH